MNIPRYFLEFILHTHEKSLDPIKNSLSEFGEDLIITDCQDAEKEGKNFKIGIITEEPTAIFDICAQFGRIKTIKVNEIK